MPEISFCSVSREEICLWLWEMLGMYRPGGRGPAVEWSVHSIGNLNTTLVVKNHTYIHMYKAIRLKLDCCVCVCAFGVCPVILLIENPYHHMYIY